jgi:hypothetical protein
MNLSDQDRAAIDSIKKVASMQSQQNTINIAKIYSSMTRNKMGLYGDSDAEKDLICHHLNEKFKQVQDTEDILQTGKNLLYFTTLYNDKYTELLEMCLNSIHATTPTKNFDVLFITDENSKSKIVDFPILQHFNVDYFVIPPVNSAPKASIKKLSIFEYDKIDEYGKVLFLDVDSVCVKNLNLIFDKVLYLNKLYVSFPKTHRSPLLLTATHGIMHMTDEDALSLLNNTDFYPFNAGQFLFLNSTRMRMHFSNVKWIQNCWPAMYFYEQSFMNYYFVLKGLTENLLDDNNEQMITVTFNTKKEETANQGFYKMVAQSRGKTIMTVSGAVSSSFAPDLLPKVNDGKNSLTDLDKRHNDSTVVIHFASIARNSQNKKTYITSYANAHQLYI